MANAADAIASGAREERLPTYGDHSETDRLATAVNAAFDAQARAEDNIRAFAADASHELRTPLATISGWLDLYHQGGLTTPAISTGPWNGSTARSAACACSSRNSPARPPGRRTPLEAQCVDLRRLATDVVEDAGVVALTAPSACTPTRPSTYAETLHGSSRSSTTSSATPSSTLRPAPRSMSRSSRPAARPSSGWPTRARDRAARPLPCVRPVLAGRGQPKPGPRGLRTRPGHRPGGRPRAPRHRAHHLAPRLRDRRHRHAPRSAATTVTTWSAWSAWWPGTRRGNLPERNEP